VVAGTRRAHSLKVVTAHSVAREHERSIWRREGRGHVGGRQSGERRLHRRQAALAARAEPAAVEPVRLIVERREVTARGHFKDVELLREQRPQLRVEAFFARTARAAVASFTASTTVDAFVAVALVAAFDTGRGEPHACQW